MIDRNYAPRIIQIYADNGEHSHFKLIDIETGETLWEEPEESMCDSEHIAPVVRCCQNSEDILKETVENALYATGRFTTDQCTDLAEGIILYIKDSGLKISRQ